MKLTVDVSADSGGESDRRLGLAAGVRLCAIEGRPESRPDAGGTVSLSQAAWVPDRHPPLGLANWVVGFEAAFSLSPSRQRARRCSQESVTPSSTHF